MLVAEKGGAILVDVTDEPLFPGLVRTVTLYPGARVRVEYEAWSADEGGAYYECTFASESEIAPSLEAFVGLPMARWGARRIDDAVRRRSIADGYRALNAAITAGTVPLPRGATCRLTSGAWTSSS